VLARDDCETRGDHARAEMLRVVLYVAAVGAAHHLDGVVRRQRRAAGRDGAQRRDDGGFDRQRMN